MSVDLEAKARATSEPCNWFEMAMVTLSTEPRNTRAHVHRVAHHRHLESHRKKPAA